MIARIAYRLGQLLDRDRRARQIRIAEPEVDDVSAFTPSLKFQRVDDGEHVRRQAGDTTEFHWRRLAKPVHRAH